MKGKYDSSMAVKDESRKNVCKVFERLTGIAWFSFSSDYQKFFKNIARSLLIYSGKSATVTQTVDTCKLEGFCESLSSDESLIQENNQNICNLWFKVRIVVCKAFKESKINITARDAMI